MVDALPSSSRLAFAMGTSILSSSLCRHGCKCCCHCRHPTDVDMLPWSVGVVSSWHIPWACHHTAVDIILPWHYCCMVHRATGWERTNRNSTTSGRDSARTYARPRDREIATYLVSRVVRAHWERNKIRDEWHLGHPACKVCCPHLLPSSQSIGIDVCDAMAMVVRIMSSSPLKVAITIHRCSDVYGYYPAIRKTIWKVRKETYRCPWAVDVKWRSSKVLWSVTGDRI